MKVSSAPNLNFCEAPLSELTFMEQMRGHDNVVAVTEAFEDASHGLAKFSSQLLEGFLRNSWENGRLSAK